MFRKKTGGLGTKCAHWSKKDQYDSYQALEKTKLFGDSFDLHYLCRRFGKETKETDVQTLDNGMIIHKCPHCETDNILDSNTKSYKCYYCLKDVII